MTIISKIQYIQGSRRISNYVIASLLLLGGLGFLLTGLSSFPLLTIPFFKNTNTLNFLPQGIVMLFYGFTAIFLGSYIVLTIIWDVGGGYNEFDKTNGLIKIIRNGFPGINRRIFIVYSINDISNIELEIQDGINPRRTIFLCTIDKKKIPLTEVGTPKSLSELEVEATNLAKFLEINIRINE